MEVICEELPDEHIYSILLNLPLKSLLRFRTVSKRWNAIITSRAFARHHFINARSKPRTDHLILHCLWYNCTILHYSDLSHDLTSSCRVAGGGGFPPPPAKFHLPPKWYRYNDPITPGGGFWFDSSSCDGMLCTPKYETDHTATILLWNPFTRRFRRVPWPVACTKRTAVRDSFLGIGYDPVTDDYKIVVHTHDFSVSASRTYIFNLKSSSSDVWRSIDGLSAPWGRRESKPVTLDDGDVYWVSRCSGAIISDNISEDNYWVSRQQEGRFLILKFSFSDERLTIMPSPPKDDLSESTYTWQLVEYEGSLCFVNYCDEYLKRASRTHWIHIWTLSPARGDNGGSSSKATWVRAMHVPFSALLLSYGTLVPLGFTVSGDLIMRIGNRAVRGEDHGDLMIYLAREVKFLIVHLEDDEEAGSKGAAYYHLLQTESLIRPD
uniref:F-box domain-containing protein n=1 Tax=Kalanchoe fedtschenkoi TaxID=63787 RepID=A0A7N0ZXY3_KALFE